MDKLFNYFSMLVGLCGGTISYVLGGVDMLVKCLLVMIVLDYLTGVLKALYIKELSSEIGYKGIIKKFLMMIVVACASMISKVIHDSLPIRDIVVMFFVANEGLSLLENASCILPVPEQLKNVLKQLQSDTIQTHDKNN